jgi:hypothetical protein
MKYSFYNTVPAETFDYEFQAEENFKPSRSAKYIHAYQYDDFWLYVEEDKLGQFVFRCDGEPNIVFGMIEQAERYLSGFAEVHFG